VTDLLKLVRTLAWAAFFAALYQELRRPPAERTWQGKVAGVIPYDFRLPTIERLRHGYWNPQGDYIFSEMLFGVGWGVNLPVLFRRMTETTRQYAEASRAARREIERRLPGRGEGSEPGPAEQSRPGRGGS
jgi:hypothetical protein